MQNSVALPNNFFMDTLLGAHPESVTGQELNNGTDVQFVISIPDTQGHGSAASASVSSVLQNKREGVDECDRVVLFHRGKSGSQCKTLAGRGHALPLAASALLEAEKKYPKGKGYPELGRL